MFVVHEVGVPMTDERELEGVPRVASFKTVAAFKAHLATLPIPVSCDDELLPPDRNPLAQPLAVYGRTLGNRFVTHPMEGWDGSPDGKPTDLVLRRWSHFGVSGAKLVWGGEAVAVRHEGRANPNQLCCSPRNERALSALLATLKAAHRKRYGTTDDLCVGLQLTHSGRWSRPDPDHAARPRIAYRHPVLDARVGVTDDRPILTDGELEGLVHDYVAAAKFAAKDGYDFVDVKCCHGYLLHEFLSAHTRPGAYGGSFGNRTRLFREIVAAIRRDVPGLHLGVRLSSFDFVPFRHPGPGEGRRGVPIDFRPHLPWRYGFGVNPDHPLEYDLTEPIAFLRLCRDLGIRLVNITAASPYYNPHLMRPAQFPPSDGYPPPEDPLTGCARLLEVAAKLKQAVPEVVLVGTGYTYLQEYLPYVAQAQVRLGNVDLVGIGRMLLSYPELPHHVLTGRPLEYKRLCRTFSDCTTAPRNRMVSGCYPLDPFYRARPEAEVVQTIRKQAGR
jgi:2,4-dienoyl-CoA reductase-like NADH-dependent reductase (Old Yellow Enzyme family)